VITDVTYRRRRATIDSYVAAVLRTLGELLPAGEAALLADALPPALGAPLRHPGPPTAWDEQHEHFDAAELLRRVHRRVGRRVARGPGDVERRVREVLAFVTNACPQAVLYRVQVQLPDDVRSLFPERARLRAVGGK
jgi:uncharacterized protein (DUF2267 family)